MDIQHFSHEHPLVLIQPANNTSTSYKCHVCIRGSGPEAGPLYGCEDCHFYLHKPCAERQLAPQIEHPLHPSHPLILNPGLDGDGSCRTYWCSCCRKNYTNFSYHCSECDYNLDLECAALVPTLKLRDPIHLLFLFEKVGFSVDAWCSVCGEDFGVGADSEILSHTFVCAIPQCGHALHLHCAPITLPETVRHENHNFHDLVYTKAVAEGGYWDGHYCDACEQKRAPYLPVYYCKECNFACHVFCGISKELPSLIEAYENDCLQRGASLEAWLRYYEDKLPRLRSKKERTETKLKEIRQEIEALEEERVLYEISKLLR
ncbi:uncharacterized protein LOC116210167 isoform X1 [Punica granatum]|uniref:Uncharacterized protein LOC116189802 isoform X1 n=2 Tax=Punica granatum TaxID=22663 RepID=A0A6P8C1Y7_PUNGR|nr:uncharacterized protein LOC116189802 isoform X1 [Punica granatum]XP_031399849.1 uncharacterized protein LOC116210167 isoform X1 [Punica granatum]PKI69622.1 hypothetical protein CRG98_009977 [Punica granatum]